jgi:geranylgeranyl reductase family protein
MTYDAAIVGAGPAGLICGAELEKLGKDTVVFERDKEVGEPVECAGLFNIDGLKRLGMKKGDYVLNEVRGARFISPSGEKAEIVGSESKAYVVGRKEFDQHLADKYKGDLMLETEIKKVKEKAKKYYFPVPGNPIEAESAVIATGYKQELHDVLGFDGPGEYIATTQYEIDGMDVDPEFVEIYLGSVAKGFFAWVIPTDENSARVGLGIIGSDKTVHEHMTAFLKRLKKEGKVKKNDRVVHKSGGLIPLYDPNLELSRGNAHLVGDAAGQVKATTGGGVIIGGLAAKELARAIDAGDIYEARLEEINKELRNHLMIRKVLNNLGDEQFEHMIDFLNKPEVKEMIQEHGDMDFVEPLMKSAMKNPMLIMKAMKFMGGGLLF